MPVLTVDSLTWLILCWCSGLTSTANLMPHREHTVTCKNMEKTGFAIIFHAHPDLPMSNLDPDKTTGEKNHHVWGEMPQNKH